MSKKIAINLAAVLSLAGCAAVANAASVSLVPTSATLDLAEGDLVTFNVNIDFSAEGGTTGGGFDVFWDATHLAFDEFVSAGLGDPAFGRDPDVSPGLLQGWAVGDFSGILNGQVGSVSLTVLAPAPYDSLVEVGPTSGAANPWFSAAGTIINPDYNMVQVTTADTTVVPLPAAAWLFGSALLGLTAAGRRRRRELAV